MTKPLVTAPPEVANVANVFWRDESEFDRCIAIAHIVVSHREAPQSLNHERSREQALKLILDTQQRHAHGEPFASAAHRVSDCPSGKSGGYLGEFLPEELMPEVREIVEPLAPNSVSGVVEMDMGFHIFFRMW